MQKLKLTVVGDSSYAIRLADYIRKRGPDYLELSVSSNCERLARLIDDVHPDILLCECEEGLQKKIPQGSVQILLADTKKTKTNGIPTVFRFQGGAEIMRQIFTIYAQNAKKEIACWHPTDLHMTAVYAPGGHEMQLPFSIAYASICGQDKNVLYLNLSEFSGMADLFRNTEGETISDLVYGIRQDKGKFPFYLQSALYHAETFDYINPPLNPKDLYEIQEEDMIDLFALLAEQSKYEQTVWHIGNYNQLAGAVLKHCEQVFCIVKESAFGKCCKTEFERFLEKEEGAQLKGKVRYVNPQLWNTSSLQGADICQQLQNGEFVQQVRTLIQELSCS